MKIGQLISLLECINCKTPGKIVALKAAANKGYKQDELVTNSDDNNDFVIDIGGGEKLTVNQLCRRLKQQPYTDRFVFIQSADEEKEHTTDFSVINMAKTLILLEDENSKAA